MSKLRPVWKKWRRRRELELMCADVPFDVAKTTAKREATARQAAEPLVGYAAAATGEVITEFRANGTFGVFVKIDLGQIPFHLRARAEAWASAPTTVMAH